MARYLIPSDATIKAVRNGDPRKRLTDGDGLYLLLFAKGGAHGWRLDYTFQGRRKTLSLGTYPSTTLAIARCKADAAREKVADGQDPSQERKAQRVVHAKAIEAEKRQQQGLPPINSFEEVAREWFEVRRGGWAEGYSEKVIARLEADVFPYVGSALVTGITPTQLLEVLRRIEARGVIETAHRALESCGQIFRYAIATGRSTTNPARDLKDALRRPEPQHFPAITDPKRFGELLRTSDAYAATPVVRAALKLAPMLLLRPGELRFAEWPEIDLDAALWTVPSVRMKRELREKQQGAPHLVPLPRQAVAVLRDLHRLTGHATMVFRGEAAPPPSDEREHHQCGLARHGLSGRRSYGSRVQGDRADDAARAPGLQAGRDRGAAGSFGARQLGRAYNGTGFVEQRREMLQAWADYLDPLRLGEVVARRSKGKQTGPERVQCT